MRLRKLMTWRSAGLLSVPVAIAVVAGCGGRPSAGDDATGDTAAIADTNATPAVVPAPDSLLATGGSSLPPQGSSGASGGTAIPPAANRPTPPAPRPTTPVAGAQTGRSQRVSADTVRGVVSEVGSHPMTSVVVRPPAGGAITITGGLAREIARAAGAEVWLTGTREGQRFEARGYAVRTVDGEPAADGVLARDGDRLVLVTPAGRRTIAQPLQALRGMIGARVWLVGPLDGTITSYGVLREP